MPESNLEPDAIVKVIARFVVGADGRVRDIEMYFRRQTRFQCGSEDGLFRKCLIGNLARKIIGM